jgi:lipoprotein-anchoring transpeptidase ErfK/SrfK
MISRHAEDRSRVSEARMREASTALVRRLCVALLISIAPLTAAQAGGGLSPTSLAASVAPGRYVWRDDGGADGSVRVLVSLPLQLAFVWRGSALIGVSSVSTGVAGYDTPTGTFTILEKDKDHHSNLYDDAPMPWMLRLTWDGVALHAGKVTGEPASHGCVRLPAAFARKLFEIADLGATVSVIDDVPDFVQSAPGTETETAIETSSR